jgi:cytoskeleton protein RodZ
MTAPPGLRLTEARVLAGWSLLQVADQMHLDIASVKALESGDFAALGAMVYARGHLRRYAELLNLPPAEIEAACAQAQLFDRSDAAIKRSGVGMRRAPGRAATPPPGTAAVAAAVLVVIALVWWAMRMPRATHAPPSATSNAATVPLPGTPVVSGGPSALAVPAAPAGLDDAAVAPTGPDGRAGASAEAANAAARFAPNGADRLLEPQGTGKPAAKGQSNSHAAPAPNR